LRMVGRGPPYGLGRAGLPRHPDQANFFWISSEMFCGTGS
jgi:hypothetical protein